jgi:hypothetical protein
MTLAEAFALTPEERSRLDAAPFLGTDANGWRLFAAKAHEQILAGYADGEMDLKDTLKFMRACSLGCALRDRVVLMAYAVERALRIPPRDLAHSRPPFPSWLKKSAANLFQMFKDNRHGQPWAPTYWNGWTSEPLKDAIAWLAALGLCDTNSPTPKTIYDWWREYKETFPGPTTSSTPT